MTIETELTKLANTKTAIKNAIEGKGVTVGTAAFDQYATKISSIASGSSPPVVWNYYDNNLTFSDQQALSGIYFKAVRTNNTEALKVSVSSSTPLPIGFNFDEITEELTIDIGNYPPGTITYTVTFDAYSQPSGTYVESKTYTINIVGIKDTASAPEYIGIVSQTETTYAVIPIDMKDYPVEASDSMTVTGITTTYPGGITIVQQNVCIPNGFEPNPSTLPAGETPANNPLLLLELSFPPLNDAYKATEISFNVSVTSVFSGTTYNDVFTMKVLAPNAYSTDLYGTYYIDYTGSASTTYVYCQSIRNKKLAFSNFVVPVGVTSFTAHVVGAGGFGLGNNTSDYGAAGSGGGGTYATFSTSSGSSYAIDVGVSYDPPSSFSSSSSYQSGSSSFGGVLTATGGYGGYRSSYDGRYRAGSYSGGTGMDGGLTGLSNMYNGRDGYAGGGQKGNWWVTSNYVPTSTTYRGGQGLGKWGGGGGATATRLSDANQFFRAHKGGVASQYGGDGGNSYAVQPAAPVTNQTAIGKYSILPNLPSSSLYKESNSIWSGSQGGFFGAGSGSSAYNSKIDTLTEFDTHTIPGASGAVIIEF